MKIRATILTVLLAAFWSSGALAGNVHQEEVSLSLKPIDTANFVVSTKINDTISWSSPVWGVDINFDQIVGRIVVDTADTHTATATAADSMYYVLKTKMDVDMDSTWYTMWTSPLIPMASFDSVGGYGRGAASSIDVYADSLPNIGNLFRIDYYLICEEDSMRQAWTYNKVGTSTTFDLTGSMTAYLLFKSGGYSLALDAIFQSRDTLSFYLNGILDSLTLVEFYLTQVRDTLAALKTGEIQYVFSDTLLHLNRDDTAGTFSINVLGNHDYWIIIDEIVGDTLLVDSLIFTVETAIDWLSSNDTDQMPWVDAYVRDVVDVTDSTIFPIVFVVNTADSVVWDKIRVHYFACETCDTAWTDSGGDADAGLASFAVRIIGRRR